MSDNTKESKGFFSRHAAKLIASVIITAGILYTLSKEDRTLLPEWSDYDTLAKRWWTVPAYVVTLAAMSYYRAVRWRYLLRSFADIPRRRVLAVSWIGFAAILLMPFRLGEIVRPYMLREKGKISGSTATGTVVGERVVDGLYLSVILAIALLTVPTIHPLPERVFGLPNFVSVEHVRMSGFAMLGLFTTAFLVIAVFYFARTWAHKTTLLVFGLVSKRLGEKLATTAEKLADGLRFLTRGRDALGFLLETTLYWTINVCGMWLLAWGCGVEHADGSAITFGEACALMGMLGCTILIPGPPGLLGVFQAGIYAGMTMFFPIANVATAGRGYAFALYIIQIVWTVLAAAFFLVRDRSALMALKESPVMTSEPPPSMTTESLEAREV